MAALAALFLLCQLRTVPVSQFWRGYRILYVYTEELSEGDILTILEKNGCGPVVSYGGQRVPVLSPVAPVQAQDGGSYLYRRNDFFTDKLRRAIVFYIPDSQSPQLEKSIRELSAFQATEAGTDGRSSFPWVAPIIACLFFLLLLSFSRNRLLFSLGSAFFIVLAFCRPLYTVSASACLFIFAFFLFHKFWRRPDFVRTSLNSPYILLFAFFPVLVLLFSSPVLAALYALALVGTTGLVLLYSHIEKIREESCSFRPVFIRSARMIPVVGRLGIRLLGVLFITLVVILAVFVLSGNMRGFSGSASMPSLPSPVPKGESELVNLRDFTDWAWSTVTFPYRRVGEGAAAPSDGDAVSITDYIEEDGRIVPVSNTAYIYNNDFREGAYKSVEKLGYPALEKMMLRQGRGASYGYARSAPSSSSERFGSMLILILLALSLAAGIHYILGRRRYGLSI